MNTNIDGKDYELVEGDMVIVRIGPSGGIQVLKTTEDDVATAVLAEHFELTDDSEDFVDGVMPVAETDEADEVVPMADIPKRDPKNPWTFQVKAPTPAITTKSTCRTCENPTVGKNFYCSKCYKQQPKCIVPTCRMRTPYRLCTNIKCKQSTERQIMNKCHECGKRCLKTWCEDHLDSCMDNRTQCQAKLENVTFGSLDNCPSLVAPGYRFCSQCE